MVGGSGTQTHSSPDAFRLSGGIDEAGRSVVAGEAVRAVIVDLALGDTGVEFARSGSR